MISEDEIAWLSEVAEQWSHRSDPRGMASSRIRALVDEVRRTRAALGLLGSLREELTAARDGLLRRGGQHVPSYRFANAGPAALGHVIQSIDDVLGVAGGGDE